jgi:hypothetical protein
VSKSMLIYSYLIAGVISSAACLGAYAWVFATKDLSMSDIVHTALLRITQFIKTRLLKSIACQHWFFNSEHTTKHSRQTYTGYPTVARSVRVRPRDRLHQFMT